MWHGTFIRAVGFFPLKNFTLRHAELLVCSGSVESVKPPHLRGLPTVIISTEPAPFSQHFINYCLRNKRVGRSAVQKRNGFILVCSFSAPVNASNRSEARTIHRNPTSGNFGTIFMEIVVIFHCTHPLIGIYLFFQVASFFRVLPAKLLLLLVIFIRAVTAHYLINMGTCEKDIIFRIRTIAFFSFYVIPTLYPCVGY